MYYPGMFQIASKRGALAALLFYSIKEVQLFLVVFLYTLLTVPSDSSLRTMQTKQTSCQILRLWQLVFCGRPDSCFKCL